MADYSSSYDEDDDQDDSGSSNPVRQLREQLKAEQKARKAAEKQLGEFEELKAFKEKYETDARTSKATELFESMGLTPKHASLFSRLNPDIEPTEDLVEKFAVEDLGYEIQYVDDDGEPTDAPEPEGFAPTPTSGRAPASKLMTKNEWLELSARDSAAGLAAFKSGKVDLSEVEQARPGQQLEVTT